MTKRTLRELLKKEDKILEELELWEFDELHDCSKDPETTSNNIRELLYKLGKVRGKIVIKLQEEITRRESLS